jgi:hypothetical protein
VTLALGKLPAAPKPTDFAITSVAVELPALPARGFGLGTLFHDWGMLGNDAQGDCVWAGAAHETMAWNKVANHPVSFTDQVVLGDYHAVTGPGDNGTDVHIAMGFRRSTGIADATGQRHKIDAYLSIDPKDWDLMLRCAYVYGAVGIGFEFPGSAMQQFNANEPWDVQAGSSIEGGHYVPIVGSLNPKTEASCITWGRRQRLTKAFYEQYNDEAWVPLSLEMLNKMGYGLHHINAAALAAMLHSL